MSESVSWDGSTADWYTTNWDYPDSTTNPGPPPPANAVVTLGGGGTVTLDASEPDYTALDVASVFVDNTQFVVDQDETIPDLTLAGIDGGGIITTGSGVGPVTITVSGSFAMGAKYLNGVVSDGHIDGDITVYLTGTGNIGGTLGNDVIGGNDGGTATLHVASVGTLTFDDGAALGADANGELVNDGTVEKLAATSGASGASSIAAQFTNSSTGLLDIIAGSLVLSGSDNSIGGTIEGAGTLELSGTSTLEPDLTLADDGVTLESTGQTTLGAITAAVPQSATFAIDGGTVTGTAGTTTWSIDGTLHLDQGTLTDSDTAFRGTPDLYVTPTGTLTIGGTLFDGEADTPDPFVLSGAAFVQNAGAATLGTAATPAALEFSDNSSDVAIFQNLSGGTLTITNSSISSTFADAAVPGYNYGYFYNDGTLDSVSTAANPNTQNVIEVASIVSDGTIDTQTGGLLIDSYFTNLDGGALTGSGTLTLDPVTTATIDDGITSDVGTLQLDEGDGGGAVYQIGEGLTQTGNLVINGPTLQIDDEAQIGFGLTTTYQPYTLTVTGLTTLEGGVLEAGTLQTQGGFSDDIALGTSFSVEGATLENTGSSTIAGSTLELTDGSGTYNTGQTGVLQNDAGGTITLSDTGGSLGAIDGFGGSEILNDGAIIGQGTTPVDPTEVAGSPDLTLTADSIVNDGTIEAQQGQLDLEGPVTGTGTLQVDGGGVLATDGTVNGDGVAFAGIGGFLEINDLASVSGGGTQQQDFNATIQGFVQGDTIGVSTAGLGTYASVDDAGTPVFSATTDTTSLALTDSGSTVATLTFSSDLSADMFTVMMDPSTSQVDEVQIACFCRGTRIRTEHGDVPVEALAIGDRVMTLSGAAEPIRWIGRRSYGGRFLASRPALRPILIRAGALGEGLPSRDLRVSPLHSLFLDGVLIPAGLLVNASSIVRDETCREVAYVHVELAEHTVIWAEDAPSETFLDDDSRGVFHNAAEYAALYPAQLHSPVLWCLPRIEHGQALENVRRRINALAPRAAA